MNVYTTLSGRAVEYPDPPAEVAAHLDRIRAAVENPKATVDDVLALVYGAGNPILDHDYFPGRAMVTAAVVANPVYAVMSDMIGRKEVALGLLDIEKAHAAYTVDVPAAAARIGVTQQAVRSAIDTGRLAALYRNGQWWVRPEAVASFRVSKAGRPKTAKPTPPTPTAVPPEPPIGVLGRVGKVGGYGLSVRVAGNGPVVQISQPDGTHTIRLPDGWTAATVKATTPKGVKVFVVEPDTATAAIEHHGLHLRGPFKVTRKVSGTDEAAKVWKAAGRKAAELVA